MLFSAALAAAMGFASCSEEFEAPRGVAEGNRPMTISVNIPVADVNSRAVPEIPEGYKLRCIMQLVDAQGEPIADARYTSEVLAGAENVNFSFITPADGYQGAMFWADYVKEVESDYIYNTADLKSIGYVADNTADMFNNAAADAFYGYLLSGNTSVTLERPLTRITFKCADNAYSDYTTVKVNSVAAPAAFNVMTGNVAAIADNIASREIAVGADGVWFSTYLMVGTNSGANLGEGNDITLTLGGATPELELTIEGVNVPLTRNYDITALVSATAGNLTDITVNFPGGMIDPNKPAELAVGSYINADGTHSVAYDADKAVGVVFAVEADKAYAMALGNIARSKIFNAEGDFTGTVELGNDLYNVAFGSTEWTGFVSAIGETESPIVSAFNTWAASHTLTGSNLSAWYCPNAAQMKTIAGLLFNGGEWTVKNAGGVSADFPARSEAFAAAYTAAVGPDATFTHNGTVANFFTGIIGTDGKALLVQVDETNHTIGATTGKESNQTLIRPVLTISK